MVTIGNSPLARDTADAAMCGHTRLDAASGSNAPLAAAKTRTPRPENRAHQPRNLPALPKPRTERDQTRGREGKGTHRWSPGGARPRRGSRRTARGARAPTRRGAAAPRPGTAAGLAALPSPPVPASLPPPPPPLGRGRGEREGAVAFRWGQALILVGGRADGVWASACATRISGGGPRCRQERDTHAMRDIARACRVRVGLMGLRFCSGHTVEMGRTRFVSWICSLSFSCVFCREMCGVCV